MDDEFARVESERVEIERELQANGLRLETCPPPPSFTFKSGAMTRTQTLYCSPGRRKLLREQRQLLEWRNEIYKRWSALRMERIET